MKMKKSDYLKMFSPMILYAIYVIYLVAASDKPFLAKWLEACFNLFLALVISNVIRSNLIRRSDRGGQH